MIYVTLLVYLKEGKELVFEAYETLALTMLEEYGGVLMLRTRPNESSVVYADMEVPYEVHLLSFPSVEMFANFVGDERRNEFMHLKEASIKTSLMIKGEKL